jgi:hypothetical protein
MMSFIKNNGLAKYLVNQDWASFAYRYNGEGYAANSYDIKLAEAFRRHS